MSLRDRCAHRSWQSPVVDLYAPGGSITRLRICPLPTEGRRELDRLYRPSGDAALPKDDSAGIYDNRTQGRAVIKHF